MYLSLVRRILQLVLFGCLMAAIPIRTDAAEPDERGQSLSCRSQVFDQLHDPVFLSADTNSVDPADRTAVAITFALAAQIPSTLTIEPVTSAEADAFLFAGPAAEVWRSVRGQNAYHELSRQPVILALLEAALPQLARSSKKPSIVELYEKAVEVWLRRDGRCAGISGAPEVLFSFLTQFAALHFYYPIVGTVIEEQIAVEEPIRCRDALIHVNLLRRESPGFITFSHRSFNEFFLARHLCERFTVYDARLLSGLDLLMSYPINRFLIPMLIARRQAADPKSETLMEHLRPSLVTAPGGRIMPRPVSRAEYARFLIATGWRQDSGYGYWPTTEAADELPFVVGMTPDELREAAWSAKLPGADPENPEFPVTGLSWYDAWQFCRWLGGVLPPFAELSLLKRSAGAFMREWTSTWLDEPGALMRTAITGSANIVDEPGSEGLNPDLRLPMLGFRVLFPC